MGEAVNRMSYLKGRPTRRARASRLCTRHGPWASHYKHTG